MPLLQLSQTWQSESFLRIGLPLPNLERFKQGENPALTTPLLYLGEEVGGEGLLFFDNLYKICVKSGTPAHV